VSGHVRSERRGFTPPAAHPLRYRSTSTIPASKYFHVSAESATEIRHAVQTPCIEHPVLTVPPRAGRHQGHRGPVRIVGVGRLDQLQQFDPDGRGGEKARRQGGTGGGRDRVRPAWPAGHTIVVSAGDPRRPGGDRGHRAGAGRESCRSRPAETHRTVLRNSKPDRAPNLSIVTNPTSPRFGKTPKRHNARTALFCW